MFLIDRDKTAIEIGEFFGTCYPLLEDVGISVINILHRQPEMWVAVKDRLPKEDTRVLVAITDKNYKYVKEYVPKIDTDRRFEGRWVRWGERVTHWMPLPDLPIGF